MSHFHIYKLNNFENRFLTSRKSSTIFSFPRTPDSLSNRKCVTFDAFF